MASTGSHLAVMRNEENHLRIISLIPMWTNPAAQRRSGLLERSSWVCLICHKSCGRPVPFCGDRAGSELSSAWQAQMHRVHKARELRCWSLLLAQQCFKWHFSVWVHWDWILLPCRLEVLEWLLLPHKERERKMREVGESKEEKSPGRLRTWFITQQGMWNTWEWWALFLCVADPPAVNPVSQQRWKEEF